MNSEIEKGYSLIETANLLGIKTRTARLWLSQGKIKANKIAGSNRWIVFESEIKRLQNKPSN